MTSKAVRVVVVTVEGGVEDVVRVCEQLRLSVAMPEPPGREIGAAGAKAVELEPAAEPAAKPEPAARVSAPPRDGFAEPRYSPAVPPRPAGSKAAPRPLEEAFRDVVVPPHESMVQRPIGRLLEDLAAIIPALGDTVRVNDFCRNKNEQANLKSKINRPNGDLRFRWRAGIAGGGRPARVERVRP